MDDPDPIVTLKVDPVGLTAAKSRKLQTAVTAVEHCLGLWQPFVAAATTHSLRITVGAVDNLEGDTTPTVSAHPDAEQGHLRLRVPHSLVDDPPSRLAAWILDIVVPALVTHAENYPHEQPSAFWANASLGQTPTEDPGSGIQLDDLLEGDVLLIARHDGTLADANVRQRVLDDYLCDRLETRGFAGRDGAFTTESAVCFTLELLYSD
ncbi:hypothetical protein COUCH_11470 [Couchioplanes caeruleus]|uniref:hypothetical protein n=1 Tax=Couchioplanes caeruleus TaxID=56438 RepID=UPI0020BFA666|nr:hypothetical protein [Couchioplanes caeruleus]UQU66841.1 hypothetical protein COUCH_11470 [Couchioplanes caeruleus]